MKGVSGSAYFYRILRELKNPVGEKFQTLCANCNWIKRYENNEHPSGRRIALAESSQNMTRSITK